MKTIFIFGLGLFIGCWLGILIIALAISAKGRDNDDTM